MGKWTCQLGGSAGSVVEYVIYKLYNKVKTLREEKEVGNRGKRVYNVRLVARLIGTILHTGRVELRWRF